MIFLEAFLKRMEDYTHNHSIMMRVDLHSKIQETRTQSCCVRKICDVVHKLLGVCTNITQEVIQSVNIVQEIYYFIRPTVKVKTVTS